jgi:hypothetical protein
MQGLVSRCSLQDAITWLLTTDDGQQQPGTEQTHGPGPSTAGMSRWVQYCAPPAVRCNCSWAQEEHTCSLTLVNSLVLANGSLITFQWGNLTD